MGWGNLPDHLHKICTFNSRIVRAFRLRCKSCEYDISDTILDQTRRLHNYGDIVKRSRDFFAKAKDLQRLQIPELSNLQSNKQRNSTPRSLRIDSL